MIWLAGKSTMIHHEDAFPIEHGDLPMSCYFSGVLGIFAAAKKKQAIITGYTSTNQADMSTSQKVTCQPSTFSVIYIYIYMKLFWGVKVRTEARSSHVFWSVFVSSSLGFCAAGNPESKDFTSGPTKLISGKHIHQGIGRDVPRSHRTPMGNPYISPA